jgi:phosphoserine phosphatase
MWLECGFFPLLGCLLREIVLINITGAERCGLIAAITGVLARRGVSILDIDQAVIHGALSMSLLIELPDAAQVDSLRAELLATVEQSGLQASFNAMTEQDYQHWVESERKPRHIVTLLSRKVTAEQVQRVSALTDSHGLKIERMDRLSARNTPAAATGSSKACVEFSLSGEPADAAALRADFLNAAQALDIDIAFQQDNLLRRHRRLAVFDMDSTLIEAEVIDELAKAHGVGEQVSEITERAMRGELDFSASFKERLALLKGLDISVLDQIGASLRLTEGAETLFAELKRLGYKTAILSGGFTYFAKQLQAKLGIDYVFANELQVVDGKCTGVAVEPIVNAQRKADLLRELASKEGLSLDQTIAVGDGANDLPMLAIAGLGVAFRAKPLVKQSAQQAISTLGLDGVLYLLGVRDREGRG